VRPLQPRAGLGGLGAAPVSAATQSWSRVVDPCAVAVETALAEIERELRRRLEPVERVAIAFVLERFVERWPRERRRA